MMHVHYLSSFTHNCQHSCTTIIDLQQKIATRWFYTFVFYKIQFWPGTAPQTPLGELTMLPQTLQLSREGGYPLHILYSLNAFGWLLSIFFRKPQNDLCLGPIKSWLVRHWYVFLDSILCDVVVHFVYINSIVIITLIIAHSCVPALELHSQCSL